LLIFDQLPRSTQTAADELTVADLMASGRTIQWSEIPERLWATTGKSIPNRSRFEGFGKLRNNIQHFAAPADFDVGGETLRFIFEVIDPFLFECWDLFAVDYDEDYERYIYFVTPLVSREIPFLVSRDAAVTFEGWDVDWAKVSDGYRNEMAERVARALK